MNNYSNYGYMEEYNEYDYGNINVNNNHKSHNVSKTFTFFLIMIVGIICFLIYKKIASNETYTIKLYGSSVVTLYQGDFYYEQGCFARDKNNNDATSLVRVNGNVDTSKPGSYVINYSINSFFKKNKVTRRVNIIADPLEGATFQLNGSNVVDINLGGFYQENGLICYYLNSDCSGYVNIDSNVDTNKVGLYTIKYKLSIGGKEKVLTRNVNVRGEKYEVKLDHEEMSNRDVVINIKSNLKNFSYMILPNGEKSNLANTSYSVSTNGIYYFIIYDSFGNYENVSVNVNNIDKEKPVARCHSIISSDNKSTSFTIDVDGNKKIVKYIHEAFPDDIYTENKFTINRKLEKSYILVYDESSNSSRVECSVEYPYKMPTGNISYSYISDTLKYSVIEKTSYYQSHIWVKDAYNQFKTGIPSRFGTLATATEILSHEVAKNSYYNKGIIAVNGSAFVNDVFNTDLTKYNAAWMHTSITPIVIYEGNVLRNFTNIVFRDSAVSVYGLKKNGMLEYYNFYDGDNISKNVKTAQKIIDDGVRYTFGFWPVMIENGQVVTIDTTGRDIRQALCQIDNNNFIIVTNRSSKANGFVVRDLAYHMKSLGCITAFNLDGGGSTNLLYKKKNSNTIERFKRSDRPIADIVYFVEQ